MTAALPALAKLKPNPHWARLPLFDRKGWKTVRFGEVVENLNETCDPAEAGLERVVAMEHLEPGSLHIQEWGKVADGTTFTRRCRPGQALFGKRRAYQRKVAVAEFDAVVSGDIYVLAPKGDRLLRELLPFLCLSSGSFSTRSEPPPVRSRRAPTGAVSPALSSPSRRSTSSAASPKSSGPWMKRTKRILRSYPNSKPISVQCGEHTRPKRAPKPRAYEGLMAAQQCLPNNEVRDKFAAQYTVLGTIWEALSPDACLSPYEKDYKWLTQVYESVKPPSGNGKLLWHALGAKTIELINQNVHLESVRDDVETLVLDAQVLEDILKDADPAKRGREIEIKLIARLKNHLGNPKFTELGERLEKIKERHELGFLNSLQFLKEILELAKDFVEAEKETDPQEERDRAKEALTELFKDAKTRNTHIIVERIVADIDDIVKKVRFPDWQHTTQGERLVQKELRRTLLKYKLHTDQELFDKAYGYIRQYY